MAMAPRLEKIHKLGETGHSDPKTAGVIEVLRAVTVHYWTTVFAREHQRIVSFIAGV